MDCNIKVRWNLPDSGAGRFTLIWFSSLYSHTGISIWRCRSNVLKLAFHTSLIAHHYFRNYSLDFIIVGTLALTRRWQSFPYFLLCCSSVIACTYYSVLIAYIIPPVSGIMSPSFQPASYITHPLSVVMFFFLLRLFAGKRPHHSWNERASAGRKSTKANLPVSQKNRKVILRAAICLAKCSILLYMYMGLSLSLSLSLGYVYTTLQPWFCRGCFIGSKLHTMTGCNSTDSLQRLYILMWERDKETLGWSHY